MFEMPVETLIKSIHQSVRRQLRTPRPCSINVGSSMARVLKQKLGPSVMVSVTPVFCYWSLWEIMQQSLAQRSAALHALDQARLAPARLVLPARYVGLLRLC